MGESSKSGRILCYQNKAPAAPESHTNPLKVVYSLKTPISTKSGSRYIPTTSERILDAPDFINDYCKYFYTIDDDVYATFSLLIRSQSHGLEWR